MRWRVCVGFAGHLNVFPAHVPVAVVAHHRDVGGIFRGTEGRAARDEDARNDSLIWWLIIFGISIAWTQSAQHNRLRDGSL